MPTSETQPDHPPEPKGIGCALSPVGHPGDESSPDLSLEAHLVALMFAADEPLAITDAARVLGVRPRLVEAAARQLVEEPPRGLIVQRDAERLQLATNPGSAEFVRRLRGDDSQTRLSGAALEVLAIVAYRQPITRAEIDAVRGVNSDRALATLLAHGLVAEVGRREAVGRPSLFGTTLTFLEHLGLRSLDDLPPLPASGSSRQTSEAGSTGNAHAASADRPGGSEP